MNDAVPRKLDRTECLALLRTMNLGRLALTRRALPMIVPACYVIDDDHVVIHLSTGLDDVRWIDGEIVAFQVSAFDDDQIHGWSVSVTGAAHATSDKTRDHPCAPWIPHGRGDVITVSTDIMSGERLGPTSDDNNSSSIRHPSSQRR